MTLHPLGDQAVLASFPCENDALRFADAVRRTSPAWLVDVVQAYMTVAVYYDLNAIRHRNAEAELMRVDHETSHTPPREGPLHDIPCCYEMQLDLKRVANHTRLDPEEVIRLHSSTVYVVYAIGFCPGFPYLGYLPAELSGVPRLESPRLRLEQGSVGLTGRQTGIYTEVRPGGWNIIGRTPLELVNVADDYFPLRTGSRVRFVRVDEKEFQHLLGQRLT